MKCLVLCFIVIQYVHCFLPDSNRIDLKNNNRRGHPEEVQGVAGESLKTSPVPVIVTNTLINGDYWAECSGYSEDATLNFLQLTAKYGYQTETHTVLTEDNYILTVFRLNTRKTCTGVTKRSPVLMMHGLTDSSDTWIVTTPKYALGYLLADSCYDVWLGNIRGNKHSKKHMYYTADKYSKTYWNFTFDEHGLYDLKAIIDYVLDVTDSKKMSYIGHSQGTTIFYVLASTLLEYNSKISIAICLAPTAWIHNILSPMLKVAAIIAPEIKYSLDQVQVQEMFGRDESPDPILEFLCQLVPETLCAAAVLLIAGGNPKTIGGDNLKTIFGHYPDATSLKNMHHFGQAITVDKFAKYDYGTQGNLQAYGTTLPPEYDVTRITAPVALISSRGDLLSVPQDIAKLRARLRNVVHYSELDEFWGHGHFVWANTVPEKLAPTVVELLEKHGS